MLVRSADFTPTRQAALARLNAFVPNTGAHYREWRNFDLGPDDRSNVSALSPHIRHRLISEAEVCAAVLARFAPSTAEKFIQEVFWRTYWKGWLQMRPTLWPDYLDDVARQMEVVEGNGGLRTAYRRAVTGATGIDGFDDWVRELIETGYLHNHARMWFASIWIFTLKLPWQLGADFFLRHLLDGDPASNTLSWRWVGGLHTRGKTYLARPSNIAQFTQDRFQPRGLAGAAEPLNWDNPPAAAPLRSRPAPSGAPNLLLVTEEDCAPVVPGSAAAFATLQATALRSPLGASEPARAFAKGALDDARQRLSASGLADLGSFDLEALGDAAGVARQIRAAMAAHDPHVRALTTACPAVGPVADALDAMVPVWAADGVQTGFSTHDWGRNAWPHARAGFFGFKEKIPQLLALAGLDKGGTPDLFAGY